MEKITVVHYNEIATKGGNRAFFEKYLIDNINKHIAGISKKKAERKYGRLIIRDCSDKLNDVLGKIPGISGFGSGLSCDLDLDCIKQTALKIASPKEVYRINTSRQNKTFKLKSPEISKEIAEFLHKNGKNADHKDYTKELFVEVCDKEAYLFEGSHNGLGGLPVGTTGKVLCLLSGGIDSPVSAFLSIKRGCSVDYIHFFNDTINSKSALAKIKKLVEQLNIYQNGAKLFVVPFKDLQKEIILKVPSKYRMIVYKRFMFKLANILAFREKYKAVITGDNLGQVASQTLENINTTYDASKKPIIHPVIGLDKLEIIQIAKKIGTYEISILPYEDCCSLLISAHPETRSKLTEIEEFEKEINRELLIKAIKSAEKIKYN